jgi:hypothetical protein
MKVIALMLTAFIGFTAAASYDQEEWDALTSDEQLEIIKELVIPFARKYDTQNVEVYIQREGKKIIILMRLRGEEA